MEESSSSRQVFVTDLFLSSPETLAESVHGAEHLEFLIVDGLSPRAPIRCSMLVALAACLPNLSSLHFVASGVCARTSIWNFDCEPHLRFSRLSTLIIPRIRATSNQLQRIFTACPRLTSAQLGVECRELDLKHSRLRSLCLKAVPVDEQEACIDTLYLDTPALIHLEVDCVKSLLLSSKTHSLRHLRVTKRLSRFPYAPPLVRLEKLEIHGLEEEESYSAAFTCVDDSCSSLKEVHLFPASEGSLDTDPEDRGRGFDCTTMAEGWPFVQRCANLTSLTVDTSSIEWDALQLADFPKLASLRLLACKADNLFQDRELTLWCFMVSVRMDMLVRLERRDSAECLNSEYEGKWLKARCPQLRELILLIANESISVEAGQALMHAHALLDKVGVKLRLFEYEWYRTRPVAAIP